MKIVHVSANTKGGAAIAALRLHQGLLDLGVDSSFLALGSSLNGKKKMYGVDQKTPSRFENFLNNRLGVDTRVEHRNLRKINRGGKWEAFSFPESSIDISGHPLIRSADIIHLHWVVGIIDYRSFFKTVDKPIVWTLHDMNPFQGAFHYQGDVKFNYDNYFGKLDENIRKQKEYYISFCKDLHVVAPSTWMMNHSLSSAALGGFPQYLIPNGLDTSYYNLNDLKVARSIFRLPSGKRIILFVSDNIENRRKGFDLLVDAISTIELPPDVSFCSVGYQSNTNMIPNVFHLGKIEDERLMPLLYSAVDAVVIPSREDNLPNVMLEALASGVPVIGFTVGGIAETIQDGVTGILAKKIDSKSLTEAIQKFLNQPKGFSREKIRAIAQEKFSLDRQANAYLSLYREVLRKRVIQK
jgi:glycosyltransferase involved in cell wall biosynthesis